MKHIIRPALSSHRSHDRQSQTAGYLLWVEPRRNHRALKYSYQGATEPDLKLMRASVSDKVQVKAAGGMRDLDALMRVRDLSESRCGATAAAGMLDEYRRRAPAERTGTAEPAPSQELDFGMQSCQSRRKPQRRLLNTPYSEASYRSTSVSTGI